MPLCHLSVRLLGQLQELARDAYPIEACALLVGRRDVDAIQIEEIVLSPNLAEGDRRRRFMIDPQIQFQTLRSLRGSQREIVGVFHSHPDGEANPSGSDSEMAIEARFVWLIMSVGEDGKTRARAHLSIGEAAGFSNLPFAIEP